jgi:uncharacterized protein (DUF2336 family)
MSMSLAQLQMLARERKPSACHELVCALADILCDPPGKLSAQGRALFDAIIDDLLDVVEPVARRDLAERLAAHPGAPRRIMMRLAVDVAAVAAPVLTYSPVLDDDHLAGLALEKSQDHLLAIARRAHLSERITDILVERGDALVLDSLAENPGACFSDSGAAALIAKAELREPLWRRVACRDDLAVPGGAKAAAAAALTAKLRAPGVVEARLLEELSALVADKELALGEAVTELADADRATDLAILICGQAGGDLHTFLHHLLAADASPLMKVCRVAGLDLESFSAVLRLRRRRRRFEPNEATQLLRAFQALPVHV